MLHRIFAYGTLKSGQPNHFQLEGGRHGKARLIGGAVSQERYPLIIGTHWNLPFLLHVPDTGNHIEGEVYEVDDDLFTWMDKFEDHPDVYERTLISVKLIPTTNIPAINSFPDTNALANVSAEEKFDGNKAISGTSFIHSESGNISSANISHGAKSTEAVIGESRALHSESNSVSSRDQHLDSEGPVKNNYGVPSGGLLMQSISPSITAAVGTEIECWCYFLRKFPPGLLQKTMYASYDSDGQHGRKYTPEGDDSGPDNITDALLVEASIDT